ncbi:MAG TPA: succinyl-diaminopimelate desuccinylase [Gaiellaceae bacterium]|nr:succinyl-diaminopimelate desuccinylase [Gaiellaceae bacterium]
MTADLARRTLELVDIPSPSRNEGAILDYVRHAVSLPLTYGTEEALLFSTGRTGRPLVLLAGHLDTVPAQGNLPGQIEDGWVVGLGASDMKGGVAVMVELAGWAAGLDPGSLACDLAFLFFVREELPTEESALPRVFAEAPLVLESDLVVVLEPTDNAVHAGCLGNLNATAVFRGESAHSARPWNGVNAIDVAVRGLGAVVAGEPHPVEVGGLTFVEVLSATRISGGIADNVVPDLVEVRLNYRYAPNRTPDEAEARVHELVGSQVELHITSNGPPARVATDSSLVARLREVGSLAVEPKQAWTPVAEFAAQGLDAINLGPGATAYAHRRDERVAIAELERTFDVLRRFAGADG